jgi:ABC-type polysaccharide/polyol phosphate export permease
MPPKLLKLATALPFLNEFELIRRGYFGTQITTIYSIPDALLWCVGLTLIGLFLLQFVRSRVEVD